jgi:hypothetical protein
MGFGRRFNDDEVNQIIALREQLAGFLRLEIAGTALTKDEAVKVEGQQMLGFLDKPESFFQNLPNIRRFTNARLRASTAAGFYAAPEIMKAAGFRDITADPSVAPKRAPLEVRENGGKYFKVFSYDRNGDPLDTEETNSPTGEE